MKRLCISVAILIALILIAWGITAQAAAPSGLIQPTSVAPIDREPPPAVETPAPEPPPIPLPGLGSPSCPSNTGQGSPVATAPMRIRFAPGTISAVRMGRLAPRSSALYVLAASRGQTLETWIDPAGTGVSLNVWGPHDNKLLPGHPSVFHWTVRLPASGDYFIEVCTASKAVDYQLTVVVETLGPRPAIRIRFPSGGTSAAVSGKLAPGVPARYVLRAVAGQTMEVTPSYPTPGLPYAIWGANGVILRSFGEPWGPWGGRLPTTQDYFIEVLSPASVSPYRLAVTIPPLQPTPSPAPARIQFRPGSTSATVEGILVTGQSAQYVVRALRGQRMMLNIWPTSPLSKSVAGPGGSYWAWPSVDNHPSITLPATGDYIISLTAMEPGVETWFTMEVVIPPR